MSATRTGRWTTEAEADAHLDLALAVLHHAGDERVGRQFVDHAELRQRAHGGLDADALGDPRRMAAVVYLGDRCCWFLVAVVDCLG